MKILIFVFMSSLIYGQSMINLYPEVPGLKAGKLAEEKDVSEKKDNIIRLRNVTRPTLTMYVPKTKLSKSSVIICPGGGYSILAFDHEGTRIAEWFASKGVTAFVLKYRLPQEELFENSEIRPLQDAQQAIRNIRGYADKYELDPNKIGIMGFSAGGHLAASASTHFMNQVGEQIDTTISVRPDFTILIYPVISFNNDFGHAGSRESLIGKNPDQSKIDWYSNELQVTKNTPPAFLVHSFDDPVKIENSIAYYKALKINEVASELHFYDYGGHGYAMKKDLKGHLAKWPDRLADWMKSNGWMK